MTQKPNAVSFGKPARRVSRAAAALAGAALSAVCAVANASDNLAYMGTVIGEFGTIDLDTGSFTLLGNSGQTLAGMAVANGLLYASSYGRQVLGTRAGLALLPVVDRLGRCGDQ